MWLTDGYYVSAPSGDTLMGWHLNNGVTKDPDFFYARQFKTFFYRPDIVARALTLRSAKAAIDDGQTTRSGELQVSLGRRCRKEASFDPDCRAGKQFTTVLGECQNYGRSTEQGTGE